MNPNIQTLLQDAIDRKVFTCAAYTFGTSKTILESGCIGTLGNGRGPANQDTLYDLASVTKVLVAVAFMRLFEQGKFCLDDAVTEYLPEYIGNSKAGMTIRELLTHTSALHGQSQLFRTCHTKQELLDGIRYLPPRINNVVEYSSQGFIVIGQIMEAIEKKPLDQIMQEQMFDLLGMEHTLFNPPAELHENIVSTEDCPWRGRVVIGEVHDENAVVLEGVCAHAGLFSNTSDLAKVAQAMLTGRTAGGSLYLHNATRDLMTRNHTAHMQLARGLGWQCKDAKNSPVGDLFSDRAYGHTGFTGTSIWMDPDRDLFAVLLTNRVHPTRDGNGIVRVRHIFHNLAVLAAEDLTRDS